MARLHMARALLVLLLFVCASHGRKRSLLSQPLLLRSNTRYLSRVDIPPVDILPAFREEHSTSPAPKSQAELFAPLKGDKTSHKVVVDRTLKKCVQSFHPYRIAFRAWEVIASVAASRHALSLYIAKEFARRIHAAIKWFLYRVVRDFDNPSKFVNKCTQVFRKPEIPKPSFCTEEIYKTLHTTKSDSGDWQKLLFDPMLVHVFGYDPHSDKDARVAGAVGNDPDVLRTTFEEGNTRELMTLGFLKETVLAPIFMYALERENARKKQALENINTRLLKEVGERLATADIEAHLKKVIAGSFDAVVQERWKEDVLLNSKMSVEKVKKVDQEEPELPQKKGEERDEVGKKRREADELLHKEVSERLKQIMEEQLRGVVDRALTGIKLSREPSSLSKQSFDRLSEDEDEEEDPFDLGFAFNFDAIQGALDSLTALETLTLSAPHYKLYVSSNYWVYRNNVEGFERDKRKSVDAQSGVSLGDLDRLSVELSERELAFVAKALELQPELRHTATAPTPRPGYQQKQEQQPTIKKEQLTIEKSSEGGGDLKKLTQSMKIMLERTRSNSELGLAAALMNDELELTPQEQEASYVLDNFHLLPWHTGAERWQVNRGADYHRAASGGFFTMVAGPSGTTARTLTTARYLGFTVEELYALRLALVGYLVPWQHSLLEVLLGAAEFLPETSLDPEKAIENLVPDGPYRLKYPQLLSGSISSLAMVQEEQELTRFDWNLLLSDTYDALHSKIARDQFILFENDPHGSSIFHKLFKSNSELEPMMEDISDWNGLDPLRLITFLPRVPLSSALLRKSLYPVVRFCMTNIQQELGVCNVEHDVYLRLSIVTVDELEKKCPLSTCDVHAPRQSRYENWRFGSKDDDTVKKSSSKHNKKKSSASIKLVGLTCTFKDIDEPWGSLVRETYRFQEDLNGDLMRLAFEPPGGFKTPGLSTAKFSPSPSPRFRFASLGKNKSRVF